MKMLEYPLHNPIKVLVGIIFVGLFGLQSLFNMPYQLSPSVEYPTITVRTNWAGATPYEIEREVVQPQENVLKSLPGLVEMESVSNNNSGSVTLQFELGSSIMDAMLRVSNKLNEVRSYPENVNKPVIRASGGSDSSPVVYMLFALNEKNTRDIDSYQTYVEDEIVPHFERIQGVSEIFFYGGRSTQMQITVQPDKMAAYNISVEQLANILAQENINISAGTLPVGRKNFRVRTVSEFTSIDDIKNTVVLSENGFVNLSDFADVGYGYAKSESAVKSGGGRTMMIGVIKEPGANVLAITDAVEAIFHELNETVLADQGLRLEWIYDQRPYINGAINLVKDNILLGGILAVIVLLVFLRNISSTVIVATAIPISVIGTFIIMKLLGRSLNVISLAGIAFAVGMLVDNSIVVLENIDRHRKMGKTPVKAAYDGVTEVWGAVLASTLTTIAVFLPVVFIQAEAGQLFRDIAIAISCGVTLSLIVSLTVIPMMSRILYEKMPVKKTTKLGGRIKNIGHMLSSAIMCFSDWINRSVIRKITVIFVFTIFSVVTVWLLYPKMEYLPQGNMNMVQSVFIPPSGLSLDERSELGDIFYNKVKPYIGVEKDGYPAIKSFFYNINPGGMFANTTSEDPGRAGELVPLLTKLMRDVPGISGFTSQMGIFQNRGSGGRSIDIIVSGNDMDALINASAKMINGITATMPGTQIRPRPSLDVLYPEATFRPQPNRLKDALMTPSSLGKAIDVYVDGRKVGEFRDETLGNIDLLLTAPQILLENPEDITHMPIAIGQSKVVPVLNLADLELGYGMDGIRRYERRRAFTLTVSPAANVVLEQLTDTIRRDVIAPLEADGTLDRLEVLYAGSASKLAQAKDALMGNFLMALLITYLLMAALFNNFLYPLIIMFSVPLAMAGGFIGLGLVNTFVAPQTMDILTMLGFIILVGIVVNNAILIVHQSLNNINLYHMEKGEAISKALHDRLRPIFMSAATSLFGMLPLVLIPGPGSELYRGLGSVVLGGLTLSTLFTIFLVPALLSLLVPAGKSTAVSGALHE